MGINPFTRGATVNETDRPTQSVVQWVALIKSGMFQPKKQVYLYTIDRSVLKWAKTRITPRAGPPFAVGG